MKKPALIFRAAPLVLCAMLAACGGGEGGGHPYGGVGVGAGNAGGNYKIGQPYQINGEWYYPREDYTYDETGVASWYGTEFHDEKRTANGEIFNKNELTAAHKTLPLPTLARVTNLDNGRSIVVRINDRGPFSGARIIDLSQRSAQLLGYEQNGTAKVRVQVLADESKAIADAMRHYGGHTQLAAAASVAPASLVPVDQNIAGEAPAQMAAAAGEHEVSSQPVVRPLETAPVQSEELEPVRTNRAVHRELLHTQPVQEVVQLPVTGNNQLYIQAGAFTVSENAVKLQQNIAQYGNASVSTITINDKTFYRVRLGPVASVDQADALVSKLHAAGAPAARTVID